jgi:tetratricopeptide (TPR) repeat protein
MAGPINRAGELAAAWAKRPSRGISASLRIFYGQKALALPLLVRAELCVALGEAAELEGRFEYARYLYASAVSAADPERDERLYARAAVRSLLNASRIGDRSVLTQVAKVVEGMPAARVTPRLACLGAVARGLEKLLQGKLAPARRSFEAAMGAAWESRDADGEAIAQHLLAHAWSRLGRVALAREHAEAAERAASKAGSWLLQRRLELEALMFRLRAGPTPEALSHARRIVDEVRRLGFPRLESLAWAKLARGLVSEDLHAEAFIDRSEELLPEGHPDRAFVQSLRAAVSKRQGRGARGNGGIDKEMAQLVKLARS